MVSIPKLSQMEVRFLYSWDTLVIIGTLLLCYISYTIVWRLYLSPLAKFPGPKIAALTLWYECYFDVIKGGQYYKEIERLHSIYGPIIRISPFEIHVKDPDWIHELYPVGNRKRDKYRWFVSEGTEATSSATISHDLHRLRRSALASSFSKKNIATYEPLIHENLQLVCNGLDKHILSGKPVTLGTAFAGFTIDIVLQIWYGASAGQHKKWDFYPSWQQAIRPALDISHVLRHFPWTILLLLLPKSIVSQFCGITFLIDLQKESTKIALRALELDDSTTYKETDFEPIIRVLKASNLPPQEKTTARLRDEGFSFVVASSESTAIAMSSIIFFLVKNPLVLEKLRASISEEFPDPKTQLTSSKLENIPYFRAVIMEGLRVSAAITGRFARIANYETLRYKDWDIPPGTPVSMDHHHTHLNPAIFPRPSKFDPDRWIRATKDEVPLERYFHPFGKGSRMCIGMHLASSIMYLTIATVVRNYQLELFETDREDVEVTRDFLLGATKIESKGVRVLVTRLGTAM